MDGGSSKNTPAGEESQAALCSADCSIQAPSLVDASTHIQGVASLLSPQIPKEVCFTSFLGVSPSIWTPRSTITP